MFTGCVFIFCLNSQELAQLKRYGNFHRVFIVYASLLRGYLVAVETKQFTLKYIEITIFTLSRNEKYLSLLHL